MPETEPRRRATRDEMEIRAQFLIDYARKHGPITVRGLYYQAEVSRLSGIDKTESSYIKIQRQVLNLRREGRLDYEFIADATRWRQKPTSYDGIEDALEDTADSYRKDLWCHADCDVEIWIEKDALAGVLYPVTSKYDVSLMVTRGFSSETFCFESVAQRANTERPYFVYYLGDFDRSGQDGARSLEEKLTRFAGEIAAKGRPTRRALLDDGIVHFELLAITEQQLEDLRFNKDGEPVSKDDPEGLPLSTRNPKRESPADKAWRHKQACELDAIPPDYLRELVEKAIQRHMSPERFAELMQMEADEKQKLQSLVDRLIEDEEPEDA